MGELIAQRVFALALGYEDLNDHDALRHDPLLAVLVGKDEHLAKGSNPRFIVTTLSMEELDARTLYEERYCARGEMENRIKEQQLCLFADRTSCATMRANQLRLWLSSAAYTLLMALRQFGLQGTEMATASCDTIRLKLLKLGALVRTTVRRVWISLSESCPYQRVFAEVYETCDGGRRRSRPRDNGHRPSNRMFPRECGVDGSRRHGSILRRRRYGLCKTACRPPLRAIASVRPPSICHASALSRLSPRPPRDRPPQSRGVGRVERWRGTHPFPPPAHRTGQADFPLTALGQG